MKAIQAILSWPAGLRGLQSFEARLHTLHKGEYSPWFAMLGDIDGPPLLFKLGDKGTQAGLQVGNGNNSCNHD